MFMGKNEERANSGKTRLAAETCCVVCDHPLNGDQRYVVMVSSTPVKPAPSFFYRCVGCPDGKRHEEQPT